MTKPTGGWRSWQQNPMIEYLITAGDLVIRFKCNDVHPGWRRPFALSVDDTIRQQLREMAGNTGYGGPSLSGRQRAYA